MSNLKVVICMCGLALSNCAKNPAKIVPVDAPIENVINLSCDELVLELVTEQNKLFRMSREQKFGPDSHGQNTYMASVVFYGVLGAGLKRDIAVSKGKINSIKNAIERNNCKKEVG